ncbi:MAG: hypothetical protein FWB77_03685 [Treponema sp.]|nr:hypothetical protein [Treponema sp.]
MRNLKLTALIAIIAAVFAVPVFAQSSPTNTATAGVFGTDIDNSMDVHWYSDVEFEKWAGFAGYGSTARPASLGFATKFSGGIYLGTWYNGNFLTTNSTQEESVVSNYDLTSQQLTQKLTTTTFTNQSTSSNNQIQALLGIAGMGFKIGFYEALMVWNNPNTATSVTETNNGITETYAGEIVDYSQVSGTITPSLEWGMHIKAGDLTIRPKVSVEFEFYQDNRILNTKANYTTINGTNIGNDRTNRAGYNSDYFSPAFTVGADLVLPSKGEESTSSASVGLSYGLDLLVYDKSYDVSGFKGNVAGNITAWTGYTEAVSSMTSTTTTNNAALTITERTQADHLITPSYYYENQIAENLKIGFSAALPLSISVRSASDSYTNTYTTVKLVYSNASQTYLNTTTETEVIASPGETNTSVFSIAPELHFGAVYGLIPDRFTINAGINLNPFTYTRTDTSYSRSSTLTTTTVTIKDSNGNVTSKNVTLSGTTDTVTDRETANDNWAALRISAIAGFKFNFNKNMAIDLALGGGTASGTFQIDLYYARAMFTLKF